MRSLNNMHCKCRSGILASFFLIDFELIVHKYPFCSFLFLAGWINIGLNYFKVLINKLTFKMELPMNDFLLYMNDALVSIDMSGRQLFFSKKKEKAYSMLVFTIIAFNVCVPFFQGGKKIGWPIAVNAHNLSWSLITLTRHYICRFFIAIS
jgi:hypothetical protein